MFFKKIQNIIILVFISYSLIAGNSLSPCENVIKDLGKKSNPANKLERSLLKAFSSNNEQVQLKILDSYKQAILPHNEKDHEQVLLPSPNVDKALIKALASHNKDIVLSAAFILSKRASHPKFATSLKIIAELILNKKKYSTDVRVKLAATLYTLKDKKKAFQIVEMLINKSLSSETSAQILNAYDITLKEMSSYSSLSEKALWLRFKIRSRMKELIESSDPTISKAANGIFLSYFEKYSPQEEKILTSSLDATLNDSSKKTTPLKFKFHGKTITLEESFQPELERRIALPSMPFTATIPLKGVTGIEYTKDVNITNPSTLVRILLDKFHAKSDYGAKITLRPLATKRDHYHSGNLVDNQSVGENPSKFTERLKNLLDIRDKEGDDNTNYYNVTHQKEEAYYIDSPDLVLQKMKIAVRVKKWHPIGETANPNAPPAQAIFLKKTLDNNYEDLMTNRDEHMVKIPKGASEEYIYAAIRALLVKEGVPNAENIKLSPRIEVVTDRFGIDLMWRGEAKIGFMTIDSFTTRLLNENNSNLNTNEIPPSYQWEMEILPQWLPLLSNEKTTFSSFFKYVENIFTGELDVLPKYLHTPKKLPKGQISPNVLKKNYKETNLNFKTKAMVPGSLGDDIEGRVVYLETEEDRSIYKTFAYKGILYDSTGKKLDTNGKKMDYAMDAKGNIYLNSKHIAGVPNHSSFLAGDKVAGAGSIQIKNGKVLFIDNSSGHYLPKEIYLEQVVARLKELGIKIPAGVVKKRQ